MNISKKLYQTNKIVQEILEQEERARNSDSYLYLQVLYHVGQVKGIDVNAMSVTKFLSERNALGFPCFETVSRCRRKLQAEHPELAPNKAVKGYRDVNERVYREYSKK